MNTMFGLLFLLLPSIIVYSLLYCVFRRLLRRPVSSPRRWAAIGMASLLLGAIYGPPLYKLTRNYVWASTERQNEGKIEFQKSQSIFIPSLHCTSECIELLVSGQVNSVFTFIEYPGRYGQERPKDLPVQEWQLSNDAVTCENIEVQKRTLWTTSHMALLAQGYCLVPKRHEILHTVIEVWRQDIGGGNSPERVIWQVSKNTGGGHSLVREPYWTVQLPIFPPVFAFKVYYLPIGIGSIHIPLSSGPRTLVAFLKQATNAQLPIDGVKSLFVMGGDLDRLGPVLSPDPERDARAGLLSPSEHVQHSAVALVCLLHKGQPEIYPRRLESELAAVANNAKSAIVRMQAKSVLKPRRNQRNCGL